MNISNAWGAAASRDQGPGIALGTLWATARRQIARSLEARRRSRTASRACPLDDRILRDIGITRLGVREAALAVRNELRAG